MADLVLLSKSEEDTHKFGEKWGQKVKTLPHLFLLEGPVGAGKTVWVKGFVKSFLKAEDLVSSPSFSLIHGYAHGKKEVVHVDLYRLKDDSDLESIGFWDLLEKKRVILVEWADKISSRRWPKGMKVTTLHFEVQGPSVRQIKTSGTGPLEC